jgi:putative hydrolase of the HAD superfamily
VSFSAGTGGETTEVMLADNSIRTVLFDFDGTLVFHQPDSFDLVADFCIEIGQPLSQEAERHGRRTRHEYFVDPIIRDQFSGLSSEEFWMQFYRHLLEAIGVEGDLEQLAKEVTDRFSDVTLHYHCPEASCQTLREVRARGYDLGLITNRINVDRFHELLDQMSLWAHFDLVLASGEIGVSKPDPQIFLDALDRLGAAAQESIYIGDNYWADVVGARRAGVTPVLLDPHLLFPEATCLTLERLDDLLAWLP